MMREKVTAFDFNAAFKALSEIESELKPNLRKRDAEKKKEKLTETIARVPVTDTLLEDYYDVTSTEEMEDAHEVRDAEIAKAKLARIEKIVDLDAESPEDLLPSYTGKVIIQCPQCMEKFFKNPNEIEYDEEDPTVCNVGEVCQHCGNDQGYTVCGKVAPVEEEEMDNYTPAEELDTDETADEELEAEEEADEEELEAEDEEPAEDLDLDLDLDLEDEEDKNESLNLSKQLKDAAKNSALETENHSDNLTLNEDVENTNNTDAEAEDEDEIKTPATLVLSSKKKLTEAALQEKNIFGKLADKVKGGAAKAGKVVGNKEKVITDAVKSLGGKFVVYYNDTEREFDPNKNQTLDNAIDFAKKVGKGKTVAEVKIRGTEESKANSSFKNQLRGLVARYGGNHPGERVNVLFDVAKAALAENPVEKTPKFDKNLEDEEEIENNKTAQSNAQETTAEETSSTEETDNQSEEANDEVVELEDKPKQELAPAEQEKKDKKADAIDADVTELEDKPEQAQLGHEQQAQLGHEQQAQLDYNPVSQLPAPTQGVMSKLAKITPAVLKLVAAYYDYKIGGNTEAKPVIADLRKNITANGFDGKSLNMLVGSYAKLLGNVKEESFDVDNFTQLLTEELALTEDDDVSEAELDALLNSEDFKEPISDSEVQTIINTEKAEDVEEAFDITELDEIEESTFEECIEESLKAVYENVKTFTLTSCELKPNNNLVVEGLIVFTSGNTRNTSYVFKEAVGNHQLFKLHGTNNTFGAESTFIVECTGYNRVGCANKLSYSYNIDTNLVEGLVNVNR